MKYPQSLQNVIHSLENIGEMPVSLAERNWQIFGLPTPVSGDPHS